ncbi:MAG: YicC family protein [Clostridia bacterium]|nr:YicC family protein [Clostridia bacterium]
MHSMTGYGRGVREADGRALTIELKSVNHRFLDLSLRMPRNLSFLEEEIRHIIGGRLARGHIDVFVTYSNHRSDAKRVEVDMALLQAYSDALGSMKAFGFPDDISLMSLARMPDVLIVTEAEEDREAVIALMQDALGQALDELSAMRSSEGARLADDLENHAAAIDGLTKAIEARYPETVDEHTARLRSAIEELAGRDLDETRLLTEIAIIADRSAIDEETVRLHSHVEELRRLIRSEEPVGRRLDFLVQELNREANTITSKSQDVPITRMAVEMKAEIEKMREQLQNVE